MLCHWFHTQIDTQFNSRAGVCPAFTLLLGCAQVAFLVPKSHPPFPKPFPSQPLASVPCTVPGYLFLLEVFSWGVGVESRLEGGTLKKEPVDWRQGRKVEPKELKGHRQECRRQSPPAIKEFSERKIPLRGKNRCLQWMTYKIWTSSRQNSQQAVHRDKLQDLEHAFTRSTSQPKFQEKLMTPSSRPVVRSSSWKVLVRDKMQENIAGSVLHVTGLFCFSHLLSHLSLSTKLDYQLKQTLGTLMSIRSHFRWEAKEMGRDRSIKAVVVVIFKLYLVHFYVKIIFLFSVWLHIYLKMWVNGWGKAFSVTSGQPSLTPSGSWWAQPVSSALGERSVFEKATAQLKSDFTASGCSRLCVAQPLSTQA